VRQKPTSTPLTRSPPAPADILVDLRCVGCGYNLRGLPVDGRCPECGTPVAASRPGGGFAGWDVGCLNRVRRGAKVVAVLFPLICEGLLFALVCGFLAWTNPILAMLTPLGLLLALIGGVGSMVGAGMIITRAGPWRSWSPPDVLRRFARLGVAACFVGLPFAILTCLAIRLTPGLFIAMLCAFGVVLGLVGAGVICYLQYLAVICRAGDDPALAERVRVAGAFIALASAAAGVALAVGLLVGIASQSVWPAVTLGGVGLVCGGTAALFLLVRTRPIHADIAAMLQRAIDAAAESDGAP